MTKQEIKKATTLLSSRTDRTETAIHEGGQCLTAYWLDGGQRVFYTLDEVRANSDEYAERFESAVELALGCYAVSNSNPCGGTGYYDAGEALPYRVLYSDGCDETFASFADAVDSAESYRDEMDAEETV